MKTLLYLNCMERGSVKIKALIWNTHRKNVLKCSNISMKKYQNRPTLGVKSVTIKLDT